MRTLHKAAALLCSCLGLAAPAWADYCYPGGQGIYNYDFVEGNVFSGQCFYPGVGTLPAGVPPPDDDPGPSAAERHQQYVARERDKMQQDYWGAVAYNVKKEITSGALFSSSQEAAETRALKNCAKNSTTEDCQLIVVYKNACIAKVFTGFEAPLPVLMVRASDTKKEALEWAMEDCKDLGGPACQPWGGDFLTCSAYGYGDDIASSKEPNDELRRIAPELKDAPIAKGAAWILDKRIHPATIQALRNQKKKAEAAPQPNKDAP